MASIVRDVISQLQIGNSENKIRLAASAYGVCESAADAQIKVVDMTGFTLETGISIMVKFVNANTYVGPNLKVGTSNGYPIKLYGSANVGADSLTTSWPAGAIVQFTFDGTNWVMTFGVNTDTTYTVDQTYNSSGSNPISGSGVADAISDLDITTINNTTGKTVATISEQDGIVGATFQDIEVAESQVTNLTTDLAAKAPINNPTFTGTVTVPATTEQSGDNTPATKAYVDSKNAGLTGAMHYIDAPNVTFTVTENTPTQDDPNPLPTITVGGTYPANYTPAPGDVIVYQHKEFVYTGSTNGWRLFGDEGSYALKTKKAPVIETATLTHTAPSLTVTAQQVSNISSWDAGSAPTLGTPISVNSVTVESVPTRLEVENGTLKITPGTASNSTPKSIPNVTDVGATPTLGHTEFNIGSASNWNAGTQATLATTTKQVVIP